MHVIRILLAIIISLLLVRCDAPEKKQVEEANYDWVEAILARIKLPEIGAKSIRLQAYTSDADSVADIKPLLDSLMTSISAEGGGKVIVPAGKYLCNGPIEMKSHVNLHLEEGAEITFSQNPEDYLPVRLVRWEGTDLYNYSPYIYALNQTDIAITGKGVLNGDGKGGEIIRWKKKQKEGQNLLRKMGREGTPIDERVFGEGYFLRPAFIQFVHCENILIQDIEITNVPFWVMQPTYCKSVTVKGVTVNSLNINNDGVDIDSSEDVLVEDCTFNTGDDAVVVKSGRDNDGWRVNRPSKNIIIRNCQSDEVLHGIAFGSEMSGGVDSVYVSNIKLKKVKRRALQFKSNRDRGGYIKNVFVDGISIDTTFTAIYFTNDYHSYNGGNAPSEFHDISIRNVSCRYAQDKALDIVGLAQTPIHDVILENVSIDSEGDTSAVIHVENFKLDKVSVGGSPFAL